MHLKRSGGGVRGRKPVNIGDRIIPGRCGRMRNYVMFNHKLRDAKNVLKSVAFKLVILI